MRGITIGFAAAAVLALPPFAHPDKDLEQVVVRGWYQPADPHRLDEFRDEVARQGRLGPGETFEEKYANLLDAVNEQFGITGMSYCYDRRPPRQPVFGGDIRIRLYDWNNRMLAENPMRRDDTRSDAALLVGRLPYRDAGHEIRIVRVRGREETVLETRPLQSRTELVRFAEPYGGLSSTRWPGWNFNPDTRCFVSGPTR